jgi:hypothetical protein
MIVQFPILLAVAMLAALIGTFPAAGQTSVCRPWCVIYTGGTLAALRTAASPLTNSAVGLHRERDFARRTAPAHREALKAQQAKTLTHASDTCSEMRPVN